MTLVDYSTHFWGEKHIGYHVLYENLKKGEDAVQELSTFIKERIGIEDDLLKFLNKSLNRVSNYSSSNGSFSDSWRLSKGTIELWAEIQTSLLKNLSDLSKEIIKYHDELVKSRKRAKEYDVLDAVNLMQTTTTCLQKAKETYNQRCTEVLNLKNEITNVKEFLKAKNKLNKAHEEYKIYVDKYNNVRDIFEEKMLKATYIFQSHDEAHLLQMKKFFLIYAQSLDDSHNSISQMIANYRQSLENLEVKEIMHRFVLEKSTGLEKPQPIIWTDADEIPAELEAFTASLTNNTGVVSTTAITSNVPSSNSSAVVTNVNDHTIPTVNDLLGIDVTWSVPYAQNSNGGSDKSGDSGSDNGVAEPVSILSHSYVPQFSSWLGRQKITQWRKKHSASQSNLPAATSMESNLSTLNDFTSSFNDNNTVNHATTVNNAPSSKGNFLKRYRKSKNSVNDLNTASEHNKDYLQISEDNRSTSSIKSDEKLTGSFQNFNVNVINSIGTSALDTNTASIPPLIPNTEPPNLSLTGNYRISGSFVDAKNSMSSINTVDFNTVFNNTQNWKPVTTKDPWSNQSSSSSSDDDDTEFQTSKIRSLQIKPINECNSKITASFDELKNAIDHMSLQRSSTIDKNSWASFNDKGNFSQSLNTSLKPIRAAFTGDEHLKRKFNDFDSTLSQTNFDLSHSGNEISLPFSAGSSIARARPRSHTPTAQLLYPSTTMTTASSNPTFQISNSYSQLSGLNLKDENLPQLAKQIGSKNINGSINSLSNITVGKNDPTLVPTSFNLSAQSISSSSHNQCQKLPIAMALNEYIHVWFKGDDTTKTVVRVFGTVMISFPVAILNHLLDMNRDISSLNFSLKNASQIKSILPNQKFINLTGSLEKLPNDVYTFNIDRKILSNWLLEQQKVKPNSTFHNIDILRYELSENSSDEFSPPLNFTAYWRTEPTQTDLRIDYRLNTITGLATQNPLLNIIFSTVVGSNVASFNSDPEAKWCSETGVLSWTLTELSKHGECSGSLKARLKLANGFSIPASTSVQFQISDANVSKINIVLENSNCFVLSMVRKKIIAGKYFCEPEIR